MKTNHDPDQSGKTVRKPRKGLLARLARDRKGSVAIEFAMLIIPFSMLVFAILESSLSFAAQQVLANGTDDLARQLRTGQLKAAGITFVSVSKKPFYDATAPLRAKYGVQFADLIKRIEATK